MEFLIIVLAIRLLAELLRNKKNITEVDAMDTELPHVNHPAEFMLRDDEEWRVEWW